MKEMYDFIDANKNGTIWLDEMKRFLSSSVEIVDEIQKVSSGESPTDEIYDKFKSYLNRRHMTPETIVGQLGLNLTYPLEIDHLTKMFEWAKIVLTGKVGN